MIAGSVSYNIDNLSEIRHPNQRNDNSKDIDHIKNQQRINLLKKHQTQMYSNKSTTVLDPNIRHSGNRLNKLNNVVIYNNDQSHFTNSSAFSNKSYSSNSNNYNRANSMYW